MERHSKVWQAVGWYSKVWTILWYTNYYINDKKSVGVLWKRVAWSLVKYVMVEPWEATFQGSCCQMVFLAGSCKSAQRLINCSSSQLLSHCCELQCTAVVGCETLVCIMGRAAAASR